MGQACCTHENASIYRVGNSKKRDSLISLEKYEGAMPTEAYGPFACFIVTTAIWCNKHQPFTRSRTLKSCASLQYVTLLQHQEQW
jgi:hypothetical protein